MNNEAFRVCPYCAEQIKPAAKVCPWCHQWLSPLSLRNPVAFLAVFCGWVLILIVGFLLMLGRLFTPGIDFSPYRDQISVVESRMNLKDAGEKSAVYVVVVITNQTDVAWKQAQVDARFFNKAGTLIDARTQWDTSTILGHGESAFRIGLTPCHALSDYDSYKVFVRSASDARAHF